MAAANPLAIFAPRLNLTGVPWMAVGSIASSAYGEARMTLDLDVVVVISREAAARFAAAFPEESFYCPPTDVIRSEAEREQNGHFNVIDHSTMFKADVYVAARDPLAAWGLAHRRLLSLEGVPVWLAPPEYVIIHKLEFFRESSSEKHLRDIRGMLAVTDVDSQFIESAVSTRRLEAEWRRCVEQPEA